MARKGLLDGWLLAFLFWAAFLLVLEPGNIARAMMVGRELAIGREAVRILCAALIGTAAMPAVIYLGRRYPLTDTCWRVSATWLLLGLVALAGAMNIVSSFVAAWGFQQRLLPAPGDVSRQLIGNWFLMSFALVVLSGSLRWLRIPEVPPSGPAPLRAVTVKTGTTLRRVALGEVDWIEAQGNYVALHVGAHTHLHRETLKGFECQLDPDRFLRIHRSVVVALDRIDTVRSDADGEMMLRLHTGAQLRVSKPHRRSVRERWAAPGRA